MKERLQAGLFRRPAGPGVLFLAVFCVSFLLLLYRAPSPAFFPDLYAEDGQDYLVLLQVQDRGPVNAFLHVALTPHDGIYLVGNVLLAQLAIVLDRIAWKGDLADLPRAMSLVSYGFFAVVFGLTATVLRKRVGMVTVWLTCLWLCVLPLTRSPELVLGRISNCGLLAFYGALLIVLQRVLYTRSAANAVLCDILFVICVYSNPVVLLLAPFLYARQLGEFWRKRTLQMSLAETISAICVLICCAICAVLSVRASVLTPATYMNTPFAWEHAIELIVARFMLFPLIYPVYKWMSNLSILAIAAVAGWAIWKAARRGTDVERWWYIITVFGLLSFSIVSAAFRPGISTWFKDYAWWAQSHPEFFYVENYLAILLIALLLNDLAHAGSRLARGAIAVLAGSFVMFTLLAGQSSTVGPWNLYLGTFQQELELRYWGRSYADDYESLNRDGKFLYVRTSPFPHVRADGKIDDRWWSALLPREAAEHSRIRAGAFQDPMSKAAAAALSEQRAGAPASVR